MNGIHYREGQRADGVMTSVINSSFLLVCIMLLIVENRQIKVMKSLDSKPTQAMSEKEDLLPIVQ